MYLIDTDVISELRKKDKADVGVRSFFDKLSDDDAPAFLSVVTVGELRRGVELIRHRGDLQQARKLENWLHKLLAEYAEHILPLDVDSAQVWGRLRVPHPENALDKQIAGTALTHGLAVVTRNQRHYVGTGVTVVNPFSSNTAPYDAQTQG
ncbi:type II toxin-antitoxin system VapC family toxin [Hydrocarboniphaga sp.]|uniref:type II toxin-antitoxin system VapC family toxin n=1 Tax=Hydrocarboniphaga sp. TaxID=2033016 RepID=UPI003D142096